MKTKLEKIIAKYSEKKYNEGNYFVGGGLAGVKFESNRHHDAKHDAGKLTLGKTVQMFKTAIGLDIELIKEIINYAIPNMEWHHAGLLPKAYGGGMKKTYFLNSSEIVEIATNWNNLIEKLEISKNEKRIKLELEKNKEQRQQEFFENFK